jgi:DNA-binding CsgD family transcriptional regulator
MADISEREGQVLAMAARGLTDDSIAKELDISVATVRGYWLRVRTKLGGSSRAELVGQWIGLNSRAESARMAEEHQSQTRDNREDFERVLAEERTAMDSVFNNATATQRKRISGIRKESDEAMHGAHDANSNGSARKGKKKEA